MKDQKQYTFKIVLTGPESTGKTSLAALLAKRLGAAWVPEFARFYLAHLGRPYRRDDLQSIGRGQNAWNDWFLAKKPDFLVFDTDWTVLQIWEHYRFGRPEDGQWHWKKGYPNPQNADLYLLCAPDFPWAPDPLREHPDERDTLFNWYERLLRECGAPFLRVGGSLADRADIAISAIAKYSGPS